MKRAFWCVVLAVFLLGSAVLAACQPAKPAAPAASQAIKIGGTIALTGPFSIEWGPSTKLFMLEWERAINDQGGIFVKEKNAKLPVRLIFYDDGSNADRSVELYERLATVDKVDFFIGPASSPITIKASTVAEKYGIPMVGVEANSPIIYSRGFKWLVGTDQPAPQWAEEYYKMLKSLAEKKTIPQYKTAAVVSENTPHTMDVGWGGANLASIAGLQVVANETVPANATDFSALISKLKGLNPDVLYVAGWAGTDAAFAKQAYELGLKPKEFSMPHSTLNPAWYGMAGAGAANGLVGVTHEAIFKKGQWQLYRNIRESIGQTDPFGVGSSYAAIRFIALETLVRAVEKAGTLDRAKVMEALKATDYETLHGQLKFQFGAEIAGKKVDGVGNKKVNITQWQDGKIVVIWPPDVANASFRPRQ